MITILAPLRRLSMVMLGSLIMLTLQANAQQDEEPTALALVNGEIYTVETAQPRAEALLIENGRISLVGSSEQILAAAPTTAQVVDLAGRFVMPGFQDAHLHAAEAGFNDLMCVFSETHERIEDYRDEMLECADLPANADAPWMLGSGVSVSEMLLDTSTTPRQFLDELFGDWPVLILDNLGHGAWANSRALTLAGYNPEQPSQPQGGFLLTDENAAATGVVFENAQQKLRDAAFTESDPQQQLSYQALLQAMQTLGENGITTVSDAGGYWTRNDPALWYRAETEGKMTVRAFNALYLYPDQPVASQMAAIKAGYRNDPAAKVHFNLVKIYIDGILSMGTAALKAPYEELVVPELNLPTGFEYFKRDVLFDYAAKIDDLGMQMHFHVTGDRGASIALDAIAHATAQNHSSDRRHRLTHGFLLDPADYSRFVELDAAVDFQLNPSSLDTTYYRPFLAEIIGERADQLFAIRDVLDAGVNVMLSSDYDAGPLSPLGTIQRALTRADNPAQRVPDIDTAIAMTTINVAHHLHQEKQSGSIAVGKVADIIVLSEDITRIAIARIDDTEVLATLLGGEVVFDRSGLFAH